MLVSKSLGAISILAKNSKWFIMNVTILRLVWDKIKEEKQQEKSFLSFGKHLGDVSFVMFVYFDIFGPHVDFWTLPMANKNIMQNIIFSRLTDRPSLFSSWCYWNPNYSFSFGLTAVQFFTITKFLVLSSLTNLTYLWPKTTSLSMTWFQKSVKYKWIYKPLKEIYIYYIIILHFYQINLPLSASGTGLPVTFWLKGSRCWKTKIKAIWTQINLG